MIEEVRLRSMKMEAYIQKGQSTEDHYSEEWMKLEEIASGSSLELGFVV